MISMLNVGREGERTRAAEAVAGHGADRDDRLGWQSRHPLHIPSGREVVVGLIDHPSDVTRLTWNAHHLWWRYFDELNAVLQPLNPGDTAWAPIFSAEPYYMLQCDFCYMIGPAMFVEFVRPEVAASCQRLTNSFFHLVVPANCRTSIPC